ncbi:MAG: hypothetical protein JWQ04_2643 [Pedosphaera sp.]|nr:hypothetical protein [Pedosphaera sp.]
MGPPRRMETEYPTRQSAIEETMNETSMCKQLFFGAVAGLIGTFAIGVAIKAGQKMVPDAQPPMRDDPGKFIVQKAKQALPEPVRKKVPPNVETVAAKYLGFAYGMTFGALYAALRPQGGAVLRDGLALGTGNWAIGYLGWLPSTGLTPSPREYNAKQIAVPLAEHAVYGAATVAAYDWLVEHF